MLCQSLHAPVQHAARRRGPSSGRQPSQAACPAGVAPQAVHRHDSQQPPRGAHLRAPPRPALCRTVLDQPGRKCVGRRSIVETPAAPARAGVCQARIYVLSVHALSRPAHD